MARYLAARANSGASIATIRLATSAISKAHEWAKLETPCRDPGVRASLKGWGTETLETPAPVRRPHRRRPRRDQAHCRPAQEARPRDRDAGAGCGKGQARPGSGGRAVRRRGLRRSEASALDLGRRAALGRRQRPHHRGPLEDRRRTQGAVVAVTPAAMDASPPSGRRGLAAGRRCSGCRSPRSPGG